MMDRNGLGPRRKSLKTSFVEKYGDAEEGEFDSVIPFGDGSERVTRNFPKPDHAAVAALDTALEKFGLKSVLAALVELLDSRAGSDIDPETTFDDLANGEQYATQAQKLDQFAGNLP